MNKLLTIIASLLVANSSWAANYETYVYNVCDTDTLCLDYYRAEAENAPLMVFAFGSGFMAGERHCERYDKLFNFLCDNGVSVATIDYRTVLLADGQESISTVEGFCNALYKAIVVAVTDFASATAYLVENVKQLGFDPTKVFAAGSSAGAITALQTELSICNGELPGLTPDFNYAGMISMAGAVCALGEPEWETTPAPMLLFHGDADSNVPFNKICVGDIGLYGSEFISNQLTEVNAPHQIHIVRGATHNVCHIPCVDYQGEILDFIRAVSQGRFSRIVVIDDAAAIPQEYKTEFTVEDYIRSNME